VISVRHTTEIDEASLKVLFDRSLDRLKAFIAPRLTDRLKKDAGIEDLLQETWLAALKNRRTLQIGGPGDMERWLLSIAQNCLLNAIKASMRIKRGGHAQILNDYPRAGSYADLFCLVISPTKSPSSAVASDEATAAIKKALASLPDSRRDVVVDRFIHGKSWEEIAVDRNSSESAVRSLAYHALRSLQSQLGPAYAYLSDAPSTDGNNGHSPENGNPP
jgi:RNA polymerase sigma factor (sigma-70 family)